MPTPPASRHSRVRTKLIIEICSDDDDGSGCAQGEDAVTAGGGKGPKLIKPEPVDDVGINTKFKGGQGRALAAVPPRPENPISRLPRTQNPRRRRPPALPIAAAGPSRCPQPEVIDISSDDDGNEEEFRGFSSGSRPQKVLHIKGNGQGDRRVKKEPFDDLVYPARSPAAGTRATVGDSAPGSSIVKRKLKTESPDTDRARPRERGGNRDGAAGTRATVGDSAPGSSIVKTKRQTESPDRARPRKRAGHRDGAAGTRATVGDSAPGSSIVKTKRQTESPHRARPRKRGGHCDGRARSRSRSDSRGGRHVGGRGGISSNSGASGTGRRRARPEAGSSRDRNNGKNRVSSRGGEVDRSRLAKKAPVSSEESCGTSGKARRGGPPPIGGVGATVGSRIRSRARQQGRMQPASHTALVVSDGTDEHGVEKDQVVRRSALEHNTDVKEMEKREEVAMDVGGEGSPGDNGAGHVDEQDKYVVGENREDDNGDRHGEQGQAAAAVGVQQEMEGNNELVEERDDSDEESHSIYHGDDEHGEESGGEDDEFDTAEKAHSHAPSNAMAAGSARSGGNRTRTYRTRIFEGLCLSENPDETVGEGIVGRTRSKRKCLDKKLLRRGSFGKPVKIDVSESSSESEEEIVPPATPPQGQPSSGEDYNEARRERRRKKGKQKKKPSTSSDEYEVKTRNYRRLEKGQAAMERGKTYGGLRHSAPDGGGNISNAQDDLSFKKYANIAAMKKHQASRAKAAYDELLNSLFADWENHTNAFVPAYAQNGNTLPLKFSFGDENEGDKSDEEEVWREFDDAIEFINTDAHGCEEDDTCNVKNVIPVKAISCENGMHEFIIDDQIGIRCKHCNVVDLEIRYVLPSMGKFSTQRDSIASPELDLFKEMLTLFEKNDLLVSNGNEGAFRIGAHKTGSVWDLIPGVKKDMFLHQRDAFEFAWGKLAGSTEIEEIHELRRAANSDIGGGCVISHAPGTGKTRLAITFVQSYLELFPQCCPVIIAPRAMLATWEQEFKKWKVKLPFHVLNSTEINYSDDKTIEAKIEKDGSFGRRLWANKMDQNYRRLVKLTSWVNGTSIIGVSYSLFRKLANDKGMDGDNVRKLILERPDLLVLDEGHTPRNKKSLIWRVLAQVRTEKRIILSGTLFQNNFEELYNTLYLVRPNDAMLLEKDEGKDWTSLRLSTITEASIDKVRAKLEPIVHYHKGNFLEKSLPGLKETVVILSPLPRQKEIISSMEKTMAMGTLDAEYKISLALVHPSLITCANLSEKEACLVDRTLLENLRSDPCEGVKTKFVVEVIHQCQVLNERVLVFSQYLEPLSLIMDQLKKRFNWTEDKEILQMSGNVRVKQREAMMAAFNNMKSEAKVMLASTKACCEGITLVGASRVVLLDVVWNPSVGRQAIGRAYRIGQKKIVYTYNLIADGTKEMEKYNRQAKKEYMSKMLFSNEEQPEGSNKSAEATFSDRVLEAMTGREDLKDLFVEIRVENQTNGSIRDAACRRDGEEHNNIKG